MEIIRPPAEEIARVQALWISENLPSVLDQDPENAPRVKEALACIYEGVGMDVDLS